MLTTSAPGKTILLGEYAVLWGGPALVVAIDRRATCRFEPGAETVISAPGLGDHRPDGVSTGQPLAFIAALCDDLEVPTGRYTLDSGALYADAGGERQMLGLGSSAAASVAFAGAVWAAHGARLDETARRRVFAHVMAAHQRVQGGGSGADVAASTYGGALRYRWLEGADAPDEAGSETLPVEGVGTAVLEPLTSAHPHILAVWTGAPADTPSFIRQVSALEADAPTDWRRWMGELSAAAEAGVGAWSAGDLGPFRHLGHHSPSHRGDPRSPGHSGRRPHRDGRPSSDHVRRASPRRGGQTYGRRWGRSGLGDPRPRRRRGAYLDAIAASWIRGLASPHRGDGPAHRRDRRRLTVTRP